MTGKILLVGLLGKRCWKVPLFLLVLIRLLNEFGVRYIFMKKVTVIVCP